LEAGSLVLSGPQSISFRLSLKWSCSPIRGSMTRASEESEISSNMSTVLGLMPQVRDTAVRLRRSYRLKLPDAIVAATALALGAELVTNDDQFKRIADLIVSRVTLANTS
jgi:predicted nucleic acid-binding protein